MTVANNVNQLAKVANTTGQVPYDAAPTRDEIRVIFARVDEALDAIVAAGGGTGRRRRRLR